MMNETGPKKNDQGKTDPKKIQQIKKRILVLENLIQETKARLPAHSTKPPVMMDLLELEDELDELLAELKSFREGE
jgi:uncharacterized protein YeeX (DUF496 family)